MADAPLEQRLTVLETALRQIGRMKLFPDDKINRMTLLAAIRLAERAMQPSDEAAGVAAMFRTTERAR